MTSLGWSFTMRHIATYAAAAAVLRDVSHARTEPPISASINSSIILRGEAAARPACRAGELNHRLGAGVDELELGVLAGRTGDRSRGLLGVLAGASMVVSPPKPAANAAHTSDSLRHPVKQT